ncbi:CDP-paratose 2-epimerase [Candidatus Roizmanbacteria bacterium RIFCSPHIGHO2_01_FULL_35_10]|uniref:CDP-paratose 2-epimerase n=1 Tax=Candidatus Roizmanbacteria bacterium RIFCSPLOWO2_01_FULL_35_13 TaxID=1802055 RepID=A0A1F7I6V5_9BACT|nr:MAG: CDP-paratose 2-epimerase [Candidatus Roizmanbacteria bacterium RIFCSPHIGHO2_01_FULL_35_10]OGK39100.1 MAG: CDP-paratose 2-epimerase [Candidatus Roizmanbacteria bacterium RIFCSPLOWO2_01_FULL_35_13]
MKRLIIGGAGFIGINLAEYLLTKGEDVLIFDNLSRKGTSLNFAWIKKTYPQVKFVKGDIRTDYKKLVALLGKVDVAYHLAGQVAVTNSVADPRYDFENNAIGSFNVLEAARLSDKPPILFYSSTNKVYGAMEDVKTVKKKTRYEFKKFPNGISEKRLLDFHSPYGCSKGMADQYFRDYARIYGLKTVVFRQSCIYGKRQFGIEDQGWIAWFIIAILLNKPITMYGNGKQVRDILFITDLIQAYELAEKNIKKTSGQIYNIGGGKKFTLSLLETFAYLEKLYSKKINYKTSDWRPGDQPIYVSDISKAKEDFGWSPKISPEKGVKFLFDWVKQNKELFKNF